MDINYTAFDKNYSFTESWKAFKGHSFLNKKQWWSYIPIVFFAILFVPFFLLLLIAYFFVMIPLTFIATWILILIIKQQGQQVLRIEQFCADNGFTFNPTLDVGEQNGAIFNKGHTHTASKGIHGSVNGHTFVMFAYEYTTGSGRNSKTYKYGVTKILLNNTFPHIILDNKRDGSVPGMAFHNSQRLSLNNEFDKHFTVYAPRKYEIEVLQLLNPSVMQALLEIHQPMDVEIIGNYLYIYNSGSSYDEKVFRAKFQAIEQITTSTKNIQKTFKMAEQIGDYKPILKKSIMPTVIGTVFLIIYVILEFIFRS